MRHKRHKVTKSDIACATGFMLLGMIAFALIALLSSCSCSRSRPTIPDIPRCAPSPYPRERAVDDADISRVTFVPVRASATA